MGCGASASKYGGAAPGKADQPASAGSGAPAGSDASPAVNMAMAAVSAVAPDMAAQLQPAVQMLAPMVMGGMAGGGDGPEDGMEEDEDVLDEREVEAVNIDLDQAITRKEWIAIMGELDIDRTEAADMYQEVCEDLTAEGVSTEGGVPLREMLEELKIEVDDSESVKKISTTIDAARAKLAEAPAEEPEEQAVDIRGLDAAVDKIVRMLDLAQRPAEDTWAVVEEGKVPFSKAQKALVASFSDKQEELVEKVKACMACPPFVCSAGGQNACRELCIAEVSRIVEECTAAGTQFTDPDWDMTSAAEAVLYVDKEKPGYDCTVGEPAGYKRLSELIAEPQLFKGGVRAGDIIQGRIGTCFLLGAMGAVSSNNPNAIKKMFIKYDMKVGVYGVRFCLEGEWIHVIVDDWMPVDQNDNLMYARSNDAEEIWCPLLEKAYCKLHTSYEACDGGFSTEAIFNFFGGVSGKIDITDAHKADPPSYFKALQNARKRGWLLTTSFQPKEPAGEAAGKCGEATFKSGLVGGHCYSVLRVVEALGNQLISIRNPWGTGEWLGKWSDKNSEGEWTDEMKEACGYTGLNDGKFWMSIQDFMENTGGVKYARQFGPSWKKVTHYKHFQKGAMLATAKFAYEAKADDEIGFAQGATVEVKSLSAGWWYGHATDDAEAKDGFFPGNYVSLNDRPVARFDFQGTVDPGVDGPMTAVVMVMQPDASRQRKFYRRKEDGLNYKDTSYPCIKLCVVNPEGKVQMKKVGYKRCMWGELQIPGGEQWRIYAYAVDGLGSAFTLRVYLKDGTGTVTEVPGADISELRAAIAAK